MNISLTSRLINLLYNYFEEKGDFLSIAELKVKNSLGSTKIDYIVKCGDPKNINYYIFEIKIIKKNISLIRSSLSLEEKEKKKDEQSRIKKQYCVLSSLEPSHWNSLIFPAESGKLFLIYLFIDSIFVSDFLKFISYDQSDSYLILNRNNYNFGVDSNMRINFPSSNPDLISYISNYSDIIKIPFTLGDLTYKNDNRAYNSPISRRQGKLLVKFFGSYLFEKISTIDRQFRDEDFYDAIFSEVVDRFDFGHEDKKAIIKIIRKFLNYVSETKYRKNRSILMKINSNNYKIVPRKVSTLKNNIDEIKKSITKKLKTIILDEYIH
ncbi:MAG: hypothetical protein K9W44_05015 [Candidatus Lokiarchaeota archaeon]|nr:hypothetical protein [Candidatus Harpocratesius repetitus]